MRLSVALCTYNGARYLTEQLASIAGQERLPDELVVCDDCSADDTRAILAAFAAHAPFPVRLHLNEANLGSIKNFEQAIRLCAGEIIALADQDDVWQPAKLRRLAEVLAAQPQAGAVFSDGLVVDESLDPVGYRLWEAVDFGPAAQRRMAAGAGFAMLLDGDMITGATLAFRAVYRELFLPLPTHTRWIHDAWIVLLIAAAADLAFVGEPLIHYRRHRNQQIGIRAPAARPTGLRKSPLRERGAVLRAFAREVENLRYLRERLHAGSAGLWRHDSARVLDRRLRHFEARAGMPGPRWRRLPLVLRELLTGRYGRYANGLGSAAKDLLL